MKRNKEAQYRIKLIQENHFKKASQRSLDKEIRLHYIGYKDVYDMWKRGNSLLIMATLSMHIASGGAAAGVTTAEMSETLRKGFIPCIELLNKMY